MNVCDYRMNAMLLGGIASLLGGKMIPSGGALFESVEKSSKINFSVFDTEPSVNLLIFSFVRKSSAEYFDVMFLEIHASIREPPVVSEVWIKY